MNTAESRLAPAPGTRFALSEPVERYPHFAAPAGEHGRILPGAESWDNEITWAIEDDCDDLGMYAPNQPVSRRSIPPGHCTTSDLALPYVKYVPRCWYSVGSNTMPAGKKPAWRQLYASEPLLAQHITDRLAGWGAQHSQYAHGRSLARRYAMVKLDITKNGQQILLRISFSCEQGNSA